MNEGDNLSGSNEKMKRNTAAALYKNISYWQSKENWPLQRHNNRQKHGSPGLQDFVCLELLHKDSVLENGHLPLLLFEHKLNGVDAATPMLSFPTHSVNLLVRLARRALRVVALQALRHAARNRTPVSKLYSYVKQMYNAPQSRAGHAVFATQKAFSMSCSRTNAGIVDTSTTFTKSFANIISLQML